MTTTKTARNSFWSFVERIFFPFFHPLEKMSGEVDVLRRELTYKQTALNNAADRHKRDLERVNKIIFYLTSPNVAEAIAVEDWEKAYCILAPDLDPDGFRLYREAKAVTGIDVFSYYPYEDNKGYFEEADGNALLKWLESAAFGSRVWEQVGRGYERATKMTINEGSKEYKEYRKVICKSTIMGLVPVWKGW